MLHLVGLLYSLMLTSKKEQLYDCTPAELVLRFVMIAQLFDLSSTH
jgi:hypothetical protein